MILITFLSFLISFFGQKPELKVFSISGYAQGTTYHITYYTQDSIINQHHTDSILAQLDSSLSIYKTYSLISRFNQLDRQVMMDTHLQTVVQQSLKIYHETDGAFDITVNPLVDAWGFGPQKKTNYPDSGQVRSILTCVGSDKLTIKNRFLQKSVPCLKIDVNGIAQGYSVDVVANFLEQKKIKNYLVEIGGEIRIKGKKPNGKLMQIGIESPAENSNAAAVVQKIIQVKNRSVTTSGNYRKYAQNGNVKISHLINPKSGYPIQNEMISVTVIAKNATLADGYDNALMGMGLQKSFAFLKSIKHVEAYFIYHKADGSIADTATTGFKKYLPITNL